LKQCVLELDSCEPCVFHEQCGDKAKCLPDPAAPKSGKRYCLASCEGQKHELCPGYGSSAYSCKQASVRPGVRSFYCIPLYKSCQALYSRHYCTKNEPDTHNKFCLTLGHICNASGSCVGRKCSMDNPCPVEKTGTCVRDDDCRNVHAKCVDGACELRWKCLDVGKGACVRPCQADAGCKRFNTPTYTCNEKGYCD
jgi:hypothetical protein